MVAWSAAAGLDFLTSGVIPGIGSAITVSGLADNTPGMNRMVFRDTSDLVTLQMGGLTASSVATLTPQGDGIRFSYGHYATALQGQIETIAANGLTLSLQIGTGASGNVQFASVSVPEPTTFIPLGLAAIGFVAMRRLKRIRHDDAAV